MCFLCHVIAKEKLLIKRDIQLTRELLDPLLMHQTNNHSALHLGFKTKITLNNNLFYSAYIAYNNSNNDIMNLQTIQALDDLHNT